MTNSISITRHDKVLNAAIVSFKGLPVFSDDEKIIAFKNLKRSNGSFFFNSEQRLSIRGTVQATPASVESSLHPIFRVKALVPQMLSWCTAEEVARASTASKHFGVHGVDALVSHFGTKENYTYVELEGYRQAFGLNDIIELVRLFPIISSKMKSLDLSGCNRDTIWNGLLAFITKNCSNLTSVNFAGCQNITDDTIRKFAEAFPNLTSVNFACCKDFVGASLPMLAKNCPNLTSVNFTETHIRENWFIEFSRLCPNLLSVDLAGCSSEIRNEAVGALARNCRKLTSVNLAGCCYIEDAVLIELARNCPNLTNVNFAGDTKITDDTLAALAENCHGLTHINFGGHLLGCYRITDGAVINLAKKCPHLISVNFVRCHQLTDAAIVALTTNCRNLRNFYISGCDRISPVSLAKYAPYGRKITDNEGDEFTRYRKELAYRPSRALGSLYHALLSEKATDDIRRCMGNIDAEVLNQIYYNFWNESNKPEGDDNWGKNHALDEDKRNTLLKALQESIMMFFRKVYYGSDKDYNTIAGMVYDLSPDRDPRDFQWGHRHVWDNRVLLADCLDKIKVKKP